MSKQISLLKQNALLVAAVIIIGLFPLFYLAGSDATFGGADDKAGEAIGEISPGYEPWFTPFWEPHDETASLLFALQAAFGSGIIFYALGYWKGRLKGREEAGKLIKESDKKG